MDIRTRLVFALVAVSLGSMLALGAMAYRMVGGLLQENTLRQLDSLAETKKQDLERVFLGWQDRVHLIASRTQLRLSLRAFDQTGSAVQRGRIRRILEDARRSVSTVQQLTVYDLNRRPVASTALEEAEGLPELEASQLPAGEMLAYRGISLSDEEGLRVVFVAPLILEGERIGALLVHLSARELVEVTQNFTGLGETGETLIVLPGEAGSPRILLSTRPQPDGRPAIVRLEDMDDPAERAMRGEEEPSSEGLIDYRGQPVWVATRYLPEVEWGVVVKFDAAEEREPILSLRRQLTRLGLSLSAFAILLGTLLGLRFAKPIHDLAEVANRIRLGELGARARSERQDEIGLLARTFNQMAEELEGQVTLLHEFQKYFEVSLDMLCIAGTDGFFKRVNPAFERTLGWPAEALLSRPFVEFVHPDDVESTVREIEKLSQGIPTVSFENRYRCADGTYRYLQWTSYPESETGLLYAVARDVTESRQAQRPLPAGGEPEASDPA
ncbi:MAG: PAS domain S-box protein [Gemmatimonadota bacterium]|nr:MAG: PAS domain S-box protein [Gemmatimonadota bacterium]